MFDPERRYRADAIAKKRWNRRYAPGGSGPFLSTPYRNRKCYIFQPYDLHWVKNRPTPTEGELVIIALSSIGTPIVEIPKPEPFGMYRKYNQTCPKKAHFECHPKTKLMKGWRKKRYQFLVRERYEGETEE